MIKYLTITIVGALVALFGIAIQLAFSVGDALTPRDFLAYLVTLVGTGVGVAGAVLLTQSRETADN